MDKEEIREKVMDAAVEVNGKKKLFCAKAFQISEEHNIPMQEIGKCCNENSIKIAGCQLGCFK